MGNSEPEVKRKVIDDCSMSDGWLVFIRSRYSLLCKTTRRKEVETFIGFHDSTSEYASD